MADGSGPESAASAEGGLRSCKLFGRATTGGAVALLVLLFFPWMKVSCKGKVIGHPSGFHLAVGIRHRKGPATQETIGDADSAAADEQNTRQRRPNFWVAGYGLCVLVLLLIGVVSLKPPPKASPGRSEEDPGSVPRSRVVAAAILGALCLLILLRTQQAYKVHHSPPNFRVDFTAAFYVSVLVCAAEAVFALIAACLPSGRRTPQG